MNKKLSGVFTVILMINVLTSNIYAMEHLIDRNDREYSEILSLNDEILDSLNHGLVHSETGKDISEDEFKMEQAFKVYADIELNQAEKVKSSLQEAKYKWQVPVYTDIHTILADITKVTSISEDVPKDVRIELEKNSNQWHVGAIHIFDGQTVNYAETIKDTLEHAGYDPKNYTYEIVSGIPGIRYPTAIVFNSEEKAEFIIPAEPSAARAFEGNWPTAAQNTDLLSASNEENDSSMPLYNYSDVARASRKAGLFGMAVSESRIRVVLLIGIQALRPLVFLPFWSSVYIHLSDLANPGTDGVGDSCLPLLSPAKREIETGSWPTAPYPSIT